MSLRKFVAIDRLIESVILLQQATFNDTASNTTTTAYNQMEKFNSRDNEGIQVMLKNNNGLIEVSSMYSCIVNIMTT